MATYYRADFEKLADKGEAWDTFKHFDFEPGTIVYYVTFGLVGYPQETRCFETEDAARKFYDIIQMSDDRSEKMLTSYDFNTCEPIEDLEYSHNWF